MNKPFGYKILPIALFVRNRREELGYTQEELAFRAGLNTRFIKEFELGKKTVRLDKVTKLLNFLGAILDGENKEWYVMTKAKVYFKDILCGDLEKKIDGSFEFNYKLTAESVSWTLPNTQNTYQSDELFPFFDGLIPEGWLLRLAEKNWKIPKSDRMALLLATCQDCISCQPLINCFYLDISLKF